MSANSDQGQFLVARKKQLCKATGDTGALFGNLSTSRRELLCLLGALRWLHRASVQTSTKEVVIMRSIIPDFVERQKCSQGAKRRATAPPVATRLVNAVLFANSVGVVNGRCRNFEGVFANSARVVNANRESRRVFFCFFSFARCYSAK